MSLLATPARCSSLFIYLFIHHIYHLSKISDFNNKVKNYYTVQININVINIKNFKIIKGTILKLNKKDIRWRARC